MKSKYYAIIACLLCISCLCYAQKKIDIDVRKGCLFANKHVANDNLYGFQPSDEAMEIINKIVNELGLKVNFVIQAVNIDNACAVVDKGVRYIYYSESFIQHINLRTKTNWSGVFILAHEIGHHLNGHTLDTVHDATIRKQYELEADEFAANILGRFGASLTETQSAIRTAIAKNMDTVNYPPRSARMEAVAVGWEKGKKFFVHPATDDDGLVDDCVAYNTGDYYIKNTSSKWIKVMLYTPRKPGAADGPSVVLPDGKLLPAEKVEFSITVAPGKTGYFQDLDVGTWVADFREATPAGKYKDNGFYRTDNIQVERCKGKTYVFK